MYEFEDKKHAACKLLTAIGFKERMRFITGRSHQQAVTASDSDIVHRLDGVTPGKDACLPGPRIFPPVMDASSMMMYASDYIYTTSLHALGTCLRQAHELLIV